MDEFLVDTNHDNDSEYENYAEKNHVDVKICFVVFEFTHDCVTVIFHGGLHCRHEHHYQYS